MALVNQASGVLGLSPGHQAPVGIHHAPPRQPVAGGEGPTDRSGGPRSPGFGRDLGVGEQIPWPRRRHDGRNTSRERGHERGGAVVASRGRLTVSGPGVAACSSATDAARFG